MSDTLYNKVTAAAVAAGATVQVAHGITVNGTAAQPNLLFPDFVNFSVKADSVFLTITNNNTTPQTVNVSCFRIDSQSTIDVLSNAITPWVFNVSDGASSGTLYGDQYESITDHGAVASDSATPDATLMQDNVTAIQATYAAAALNGKTVLWPPGRYPVSKTAGQNYAIELSGYSDIKTIGYGAILSQAGDAGGAGADYRCLQIILSSNLSFEGLSFSQRDMTNFGSQAHMVELGTTDPGTDTEITFYRCTWMEGQVGGGDGLRLLGEPTVSITHTKVINCRFIGCSRSGIEVQRGAIRSWIRGCYFSNMLDGSAIDYEPTSTPYCGEFVITNNIFEHNTATECVSLSGTGVQQERSIFANNIVINGTLGGVYLSDTLVDGNVFYYDSNAGNNPVVQFKATVERVRITNNDVYLGPSAITAEPCIYLTGQSGGYPNDIKITGNVCHQYQDAGIINCQSAANVLIEGNSLHYHAATAGAAAIYLDAANSEASGVIANNYIASEYQSDGVTPAAALPYAIHMSKTSSTFGAVSISNNRTSRCDVFLFNNATLADMSVSPPSIVGNAGDYTTFLTGILALYATGGNFGDIVNYVSTSAPETVVSAIQGSTCIYKNGDATVTYRKTSGTGNTGWTAI